MGYEGNYIVSNVVIRQRQFFSSYSFTANNKCIELKVIKEAVRTINKTVAYLADKQLEHKLDNYNCYYANSNI